MSETENNKIPREGTAARAVYDLLARGPTSFSEAVETWHAAASARRSTSPYGANFIPKRSTAEIVALRILKKYGNKLGKAGSKAAWVLAEEHAAATSESVGLGQEDEHGACHKYDPAPDEREPIEQEQPKPTTLLEGAKVTYVGRFSPLSGALGEVIGVTEFNRRLVRWTSPMSTSTEWASELDELPVPAVEDESIEESAETRYLRVKLRRSIARDVAMHDSRLALSKMDLLQRMAMRELLLAGNEAARDLILDIVEDSKAKLESMTNTGTVKRDQKS